MTVAGGGCKDGGGQRETVVGGVRDVREGRGTSIDGGGSEVGGDSDGDLGAGGGRRTWWR